MTDARRASHAEHDPFREIVERLSEGVLLLGSDLKPNFANPAAIEILGLRADALPPRLPSDDLLRIARTAQMGEDVEEVLKVWFPEPRTIKVRALPLGDHQVLVALQDITEEARAQQVRREFVSHASHELKSPVAGLQALAGAIKQALTDDPKMAEKFCERLGLEADRLGRLVNDLLDLSRLEEPERLADDPVHLSDVANVEVAGARRDAEIKHMKLDAVIPQGIWVRGDKQQLSLLIRNLLDNAVRYTPEGGEIQIELGRDEDSATLTVRDNGMGIPIEAQGRVFERFFRVDRARSRDRGGTGLGLAIVKHVAESHGGSVAVDSELGRGSAFVATLPALPLEAVPLTSTGA